MANLTRSYTFKRWAPDLGENRELPGGPVLFLELATGLTPERMDLIAQDLMKARQLRLKRPELAPDADADAITAAYRGAMREHLADIRKVYVDALAPYVRVHAGPHTVDGMPLATLDDYLAIVETSADTGFRARVDLEEALSRFNDVRGPDELFLPRRSGGVRSTDAQSNAAAVSQTASP